METRPGNSAANGTPSEVDIWTENLERSRQIDLHADPLDSTAVEESVLSAMLSGKTVRSLTQVNFTSASRKAIYASLTRGYTVDQLSPSLREEAEDIWFRRPLLSHAGLVEAVEDLKRVALVRPLCERVDAWRRQAPTLTYRTALAKLKEAIRGD